MSVARVCVCVPCEFKQYTKCHFQSFRVLPQCRCISLIVLQKSKIIYDHTVVAQHMMGRDDRAAKKNDGTIKPLLVHQ